MLQPAQLPGLQPRPNPTSSTSPSEPPQPTPPPPNNLHQQLQQLSYRLLEASITHKPFYAPLLSTSTRTHFLLPVRRHLYASAVNAFWQPLQDAPYSDRDTARLIKSLVDHTLAHPDAPISLAYDHIYQAVQPIPPAHTSFSVLSAIWRDLIKPFRNHLFDWLVFAEVNDGGKQCQPQFFIDNAQQPRVNPAQLPKFVSPAVAHRILSAGMARRSAIQLARGKRAFVLLGDEEQWQQKLGHGFLGNPLKAELELDAASLEWMVAAAEQLSSLLPFDQIRHKISLLRDYLLLGRSQFWRTFFDELRRKPMLLTTDEANEAERSNIERAIMRIFRATAAEHERTDDKNSTDLPLSLHLSPTGGIVPRFTLTFAESQVLASKSSVYCDVFSMAFNVRRVACELRASFANLQLLDRSLRRASGTHTWRKSTACLAAIQELRRRMAIFVDGFEWYLQAEVLQPKFDTLLNALDDHLEGRARRSSHSARKPFYDEIQALHEALLDKVFAQCFVGHEQIETRLTATFVACFSLCDFIAELTTDALQHTDFSDTLRELQTTFTRNVGLLVRLLLHMQHRSADSGIPALLVRINFNHYVKN